jgi:hypothetical protein
VRLIQGPVSTGTTSEMSDEEAAVAVVGCGLCLAGGGIAYFLGYHDAAVMIAMAPLLFIFGLIALSVAVCLTFCYAIFGTIFVGLQAAWTALTFLAPASLGAVAEVAAGLLQAPPPSLLVPVAEGVVLGLALAAMRAVLQAADEEWEAFTSVLLSTRWISGRYTLFASALLGGVVGAGVATLGVAEGLSGVSAWIQGGAGSAGGWSEGITGVLDTAGGWVGGGGSGGGLGGGDALGVLVALLFLILVLTLRGAFLGGLMGAAGGALLGAAQGAVKRSVAEAVLAIVGPEGEYEEGILPHLFMGGVSGAFLGGFVGGVVGFSQGIALAIAAW